jgi:hypothetical protein
MGSCLLAAEASSFCPLEHGSPIDIDSAQLAMIGGGIGDVVPA